MITLIAAIDNNYGLGANGELLAMIPEDIQHFRMKTLGKIVVMGRTTWFSLPLRKQKSCCVYKYNTNGELLKKIDCSTHALKGRVNIVLSHIKEEEFYGASLATNINDILELAKNNDIFIIGGASIYKQFYEHADVIELTVFDTIFEEADIFFPIIYHNDFIVQNQYVLEREDDFDLSFLTLVRRTEQ